MRTRTAPRRFYDKLAHALSMMKKNFFSLIFGTLVLLSLHTSAEKNTLHNFELESVDLRTALLKYAKLANIQILYPTNLVSDLLSQPISGHFNAGEGLDRILLNSGLEAVWLDESTATLRARPQGVVPEEQRTRKPTLPSPPESNEPSGSLLLEVMMVTGSRIERPFQEQVFPSLVLTPEKMFREIDTNIGDSLAGQPTLCSGVQSLGATGLDRNIGSAFPDLYCLGSQRTLSLVDGNRIVSSNGTDLLAREPGVQFDINSLPSNVVDRVEIVGIGSTAVYGSDAVAGTVNLVIRDSFEGFQLSAEGGTSDRDDGEQYRVSALAGSDLFNGNGNWFIGYEYYQQRAIEAIGREFTAADFTYLPNPEGLDNTIVDGIPQLIRLQNIRVNVSGRYGIPTPLERPPQYVEGNRQNIFQRNGAPLAFDENGRLTEIALGEPTTVEGLWIGGDGERASDYWTIRNPVTQHKLFARFDAKLSPSVSARADLMIFSAEATNKAFPIRSATSGISPFGFLERLQGPVSVQASANRSFGRVRDLDLDALGINSRAIVASYDEDILHPDDIALMRLQEIGAGEAREQFFIHRTWDEFNKGISQTSEFAQVNLSLEGGYEIAGHDWTWEAFYSSGGADTTNSRRNILAEPGRRRLSNIGIGSLISMEAVDEVSFIDRYDSEQRMQLSRLSTSGKLFNLPAGPLKLSTGLEQRKSRSSGRTRGSADGESLDRGLILGEQPIDGKFDTKEFMFEARLPLLDASSGVSGLDLLELDTAARWVEHNRAGGDSTYSLGGKLRFALGENGGTITFRGNRTKSIRAPSTQEVAFPRRSNGIESMVNDPCDSRQIPIASDPDARRRACLADAAARGYADYDPNSFLDTRNPSRTRVNLVSNDRLKNEKGDAYSLGFLIETEDGHGASFAADLIDIAIRDVPVFPSFEELLTRCYDQQIASTCNQIQRRPFAENLPNPYALVAFNAVNENEGELQTRLTQLSAALPVDMQQIGIPGEFLVTSSAQVLESYERNGNELSGTYFFPRARALANVEYSYNRFSVAFNAEYTSGGSLIPDNSQEVVLDNDISSYTTYDIATEIALSSSLTIRGGVRNIFDKMPPSELQSFDATNEFSPIGRYYLIGLTWSL